MKPIVFFSRCRPQGSDPWEIVVREKRIFIGYPAWRAEVPYRRGHLRDSIIDPSCAASQWISEMSKQKSADRRFYNLNRNFVQKVAPGSIALVPRPSQGVVYAGRVVGSFEVVDDPSWSDDYLMLRAKQHLSVEHEGHHLGDVAQCWQVDDFRAIPLPVIPAWIRRSLFGRSTFGTVKPLGALNLDPFYALDKLIDQPGRIVRDWTCNPEEVERRLLSDVGPSAFEHLCVAILQLENQDDVWAHVGGSGDGGVDGLGADHSGMVTSLLQCKWAYWGEPLDFASPPGDSGLHKKYLASLMHPNEIGISDGIQFWSRPHIARLVIKHAARLPLAVSLRVSASSDSSATAARDQPVIA
jgi:hypothetical protein